MIQTKTEFKIIADDNMTSAKFSIKDENLAQVFDILRNRLYSDKILAVIREYSTNAYDANVEANNATTPIHVTLPTVIEPVFKVRDFGPGLSEYDIFNVFSSYGASTKRETNLQVGALGMGSKSAFGYSDSFTVTSFFDGKKSVYQAYIDESKIGTIAKIHEEPSSEPNGLMITIAVDKTDINAFKDTAIRFYTWFEPMPVFTGVNIGSIIKDKINAMKIYHKSKNCILYYEPSYYDRNKVYCRMGNICYPIRDTDKIDIQWLNNSGYNLIINVGIGDVSFTTNREQLELTPKTISALNKKIALLRDEIAANYQSEIDKRKSPWDAICYFNEMPSLVKGLLQKKLVWNNIELQPDIINGIDWATYWESNRQWKDSYGIQPKTNENIALIFADGGYPSSQLRPRLMQARAILMANASPSPYSRILYARGSVATTLELLGRKEFEGVKIIKLSEVQPLASREKTAQRKEKIFKWNGKTSFPYSTCWDSVEIDEDAIKVYVEIDKFKPKYSINFNFVQELITSLREIGIKVDLYGAKPGAKLDNTWIKLHDYAVEKVVEKISEASFKTSYVNNIILNDLNRYGFTRHVMDGLFDHAVQKVKCPMFKKVLDIKVSRDQNVNYRTLTKIAEALCDPKISNTLNKYSLEAKSVSDQHRDNVDTILKVYPLLDLSNAGYYCYTKLSRDKIDMLVDYVNAMHHMNSGA